MPNCRNEVATGLISHFGLLKFLVCLKHLVSLLFYPLFVNFGYEILEMKSISSSVGNG